MSYTEEFFPFPLSLTEGISLSVCICYSLMHMHVLVKDMQPPVITECIFFSSNVSNPAGDWLSRLDFQVFSKFIQVNLAACDHTSMPLPFCLS